MVNLTIKLQEVSIHTVMFVQPKYEHWYIIVTKISCHFFNLLVLLSSVVIFIFKSNRLDLIEIVIIYYLNLKWECLLSQRTDELSNKLWSQIQSFAVHPKDECVGTCV